MRLLLDTHALIWWWTERASLSDAASSVFEGGGTTIFVSAASAWEISTKHRLGKLPQLDARFTNLGAQFRRELDEDQFGLLAVTVDHGIRAGAYGAAHRDPFDRLLAAQAELEGLILVTCDVAFAAFSCETLW